MWSWILNRAKSNRSNRLPGPNYWELSTLRCTTAHLAGENGLANAEGRSRQYKPDEAERITTVPAEKIREIARIYATNTPSTNISRIRNRSMGQCRSGGQRYCHARCNYRTNRQKGASPLGTMGQSAITIYHIGCGDGTLDSSIGNASRTAHFVLLQQAILTGKVDAWEPKDPGNPLAGPTSKTPVSKDWPIKGLILTTGNVVSNHAEQKVTIEEMFSEDKLDFICCIDMFMTDTARHADLFLPCTSWFENDDIVGGLHPYVMRMGKSHRNLWAKAKAIGRYSNSWRRKWDMANIFRGKPKIR